MENKSITFQIPKSTHDKLKIAIVKSGKTQKNVLIELVERFIDEQSKGREGANVTCEKPLTSPNHHLGEPRGVE